jgi:2-amino-4-hydroxy-6-hydroxymethyldihydropteridine diphosphokinase
MAPVYLSLGSNLGDRLAHLAQAVRRLPGLVAVSGVYETVPQGKTDQPDFLNLAAAVESADDPMGLLRRCQEIEQELGRVRGERWGPRTVDIDLVLWGRAPIDLPALTVPHPRLAERAFVLIPVLELDPGAALPDGTSLASLLAALPDQGVRLHLAAAAFRNRVRAV